MLTLSYGFKKPQTGDKGSAFWPALEDDIQQLNDHTHNGADSAKLTSASVTSTKQNVSSAGWVLVAGGVYRQLVTMPGSLQYDDYIMIIRNQAGAKEQMYLGVEKASANTFYVYINDNSLSITVYYLS